MTDIEQSIADITAWLRDRADRGDAAGHVLLCSRDLSVTLLQNTSPPTPGGGLDRLTTVDIVLDDAKTGGEYEVITWDELYERRGGR